MEETLIEPRIDRAVVDFDQSAHAVALGDSWQSGWRSVLLRRFESRPTVELAEIPAFADQLIVLVTRGSKQIESWDGRRWNTALYHPGRMAMTAPGRQSRLRWTAVGDEPEQNLHAYLPGRAIGDAIEQVWEVDRDRAPMPDALVDADPVVETVLRAMWRASRDGVGDLYAVQATAFLATHLASRHAGLGAAPAQSMGERRVRAARAYMREHLALPITLADIAASAHLSPFHFARLFKKETGESPHRALTRLRVEESIRLLARDRLPIAEIAHACGFSSPSHFSTAFRREVGMSAREFRRSR